MCSENSYKKENGSRPEICGNPVVSTINEYNESMCVSAKNSAHVLALLLRLTYNLCFLEYLFLFIGESVHDIFNDHSMIKVNLSCAVSTAAMIGVIISNQTHFINESAVY